MLKHLKRSLPIVAVTTAAITLITLVLLGMQRRSSLIDSGETKSSVEATLNRLQDFHPVSLNDPGFQNAVIEADQAPYVAHLWVFNTDGSIATSELSIAFDRVTPGIHRILAALPPTVLTEEQEGWLQAAATVMAEGEHSDVFNYMLRPIEQPDGAVIGIVGVAYDMSPWVSSAGAGWIIGVLLGVIGLCMYWLALPLWVYLDANERGENAWAWAVFVLIGNFVALIAYILAHSFQHDSSA